MANYSSNSLLEMDFVLQDAPQRVLDLPRSCLLVTASANYILLRDSSVQCTAQEKLCDIVWQATYLQYTSEYAGWRLGSEGFSRYTLKDVIDRLLSKYKVRSTNKEEVREKILQVCTQSPQIAVRHIQRLIDKEKKTPPEHDRPAGVKFRGLSFNIGY